MSVNVLASLSTTTVEALTTISSAAQAVTSSVNSLANLAQVAELHAKAYRDTTRKEIEVASKKQEVIAETKAKYSVTRKLLEFEKDLQDPDFAAMYERVCAEWDK